jgi:acetoin utilization deacetylase AcuC-like enzyme
VRLPAAMKAAKKVAAEKGDRLKIMHTVAKKYLEMAEKEVVRRAHSNTYLRRMKKKCQSVETEGEIVSLTADSDNNGGEDTSEFTDGAWRLGIILSAFPLTKFD